MSSPITDPKHNLKIIQLPESETEVLEWVLKLARDSEGLDELAKEYVERLAMQSQKDLYAGNYRDLIYFVFTLGRFRGKSDERIGEERKSNAEYKSKLNRSMPAVGKKHLKISAQALAELLWNTESCESLRVTAMTNLVYLKLPWFIELRIENLSKGNDNEQYWAHCLKLTSIPNPKKVREWVSKIAPPNARKGGRPKSNPK